MTRRGVLVGLVAGAGLACAPHVDEPVPWPAELFPDPVGQGQVDESPTAHVLPVCPRRGGRLEILCDEKKLSPIEGGRLRADAVGCLGIDCQRLWIGEEVPTFVALTIGTKELMLLEKTPDGVMAMYRDPYGGDSCDLGGPGNCEFVVRIYEPEEGALLTELRLNDFISREDHIEVQDVHFEGDVLYFNEACQSYSSEAGRRCSALVAIDTSSGEEKWRTRHLVSNGYFALLDEFVAVSYGFTSERPSLSLVDKESGRVSWTTKPPGAAHHMERVDGTTVFTRRYSGKPETFEVRGGKLVRR